MLRDELACVEAHARAIAALHSERLTVGPFDVFLPAEDGPSYAVPARASDDQDVLRRDIGALSRVFEERGLPVRVELSLLLWPELPPALAAAGLTQTETSPLYLATPRTFRPRPPGGDLAIRWVAAGESPGLALSVVRQGFELRGPPPTPEEIEALRANLDGPLRLATAEKDGRPAGAGFSTPIAGTTELSGLTTLPVFRHEGVAARLASFIAAEHFAAGGELAWGVTDDPRASALLYSLGFQDAGLRVGWERTEGP